MGSWSSRGSQSHKSTPVLRSTTLLHEYFCRDVRRVADPAACTHKMRGHAAATATVWPHSIWRQHAGCSERDRSVVIVGVTVDGMLPSVLPASSCSPSGRPFPSPLRVVGFSRLPEPQVHPGTSEHPVAPFIFLSAPRIGAFGLTLVEPVRPVPISCEIFEPVSCLQCGGLSASSCRACLGSKVLSKQLPLAPCQLSLALSVGRAWRHRPNNTVTR